MKQFIMGIAILCLAACASPEPVAPPEVPESTEAYVEGNMKLCAAEGGSYQREGMLGWWRCTMPYSDAGKACSDRSDCEGKCLTGADNGGDWSFETGGARGVCQATDSPFGCYAEIIDGRVNGTLCVD